MEVLTGKMMQPTPGKKKTILLGKCIYQAHKENPDINEAIPVKGCPPKPDDILKALHQAGIQADPPCLKTSISWWVSTWRATRTNPNLTRLFSGWLSALVHKHDAVFDLNRHRDAAFTEKFFF